MLLSGASAHAAEVARTAANLANTHAGKVVTGLYESILGTAPTSAQLTSGVHKLRGGVSSKVLRKDLVAMARTEPFQTSAISVTAINVSSDPPTPTRANLATPSTATVSSIAASSVAMVNTRPTAIDPGTVGLLVQQAPDMSALRAGVGGGSSSGSTSGSGSTSLVSGLSSTASSELQSLLSALSTSMSGSSSTASSELQSFLSSLSGSSNPLEALLTTGFVPTSGLTTSTGSITSSLGQLALSELGLSQPALSQLPITSALSVSSTAPDAAANGLTVAPTTGLTVAPTTGLTVAPTTGLTVAPSSNLI